MELNFKETAEAFLSSQKPLQPFRPFPPVGRRTEYESLPQGLRQRVIRMGEAYKRLPYPVIQATDFMEFKRTGNRVDYEALYFNRRYALNSFVAAECVENKGRFLDEIINGIFFLCEESAWQLPAHNSYPGGPQDILPDSARPILDLFACETGALLACIYYLLGEQLDAVSPYINKRIIHELKCRIVTPYIQEHFWWMGSGEEPMCNWTPWCTQNVLYTYFLCESSRKGIFGGLAGYSPEEAGREVLRKASESCDHFLKDYGEDGCCDEGAQYYRHAGLCLDGAANVLDQVTGGAFAPLLRQKKIKNIAAYIFNVHVDDKYYFNFADCSPIAGRAGVREYLFGKHTGQPELMQFAAEDFAKTPDTALFDDESHQLNLFYRLQAIFCYEEIMAYRSGFPYIRRDIFYPSVGLFLARNDTFSLAVKAGGNGDSHNHNDTGSITLYKNGRPVLADIGVGSYTQKTFSPRRYEIWTMQSCYHNLPSIDGFDQHDGAGYRAVDVVTSLDSLNCCADSPNCHADALSCRPDGTNRPFISMELAGAYPLPEPRSYVRKVTFDKKGNRITLTDRTDSQNVILNFITYDKPEITGNTINVGTASLSFQGASLMAAEALPITDKRLKTAWDHELYRIRLKMSAGLFEMIITDKQPGREMPPDERMERILD